MNKQIIWASSILLFLVTFLGCSTTSIRGTEKIDWQKIHYAKVEETQKDHWSFADLIRQELATMGIAIATPTQQPDVLITFTPFATEDLNQESQRVQRLRRLHLDFFQTGADTPTTQIDYEFQQGVDMPDPTTGIREIFTALKTKSKASEPSAKQPHEAEVVRPKASAPSKQPVDTIKEIADSPTPTKVDQAVTQTIREEATEPVTEEPSSWTPRFKSWGFGDWGKEQPEESY